MKSYHKFPKKYFDNPHLIRWIYRWNNLILQRNWHTQQTLHQLLTVLPNHSKITDAGSGEGQHIFPFAQKYPQLDFYGVDIEAENIEFTKLYAKALGLRNIIFTKSDLIEYDSSVQSDLIYTIGVLQYIPDDEKLLQLFYNNLSPNGQLFIYSPVNERTIIDYLNKLRNQYYHYEKAQNRCRVYKKEELIEKLKNIGFEIEKCDYKFGTLGIISHEIYNIILLKVENSRSKITSFLLVFFLILLLPYLIVLKAIDFYTHHQTGNSVVIVARKKIKGRIPVST